MNKNLLVCLAMCVLGTAMTGCGGVSRPTTVKVSGTVTYKGKPIEGAEVLFWAEKAPKSANGVTDAEGKFELSMFEYQDGCMPGENVVTISKIEAGTSTAKSPEEMMDPLAMAKAAQSVSAGGSTGPKSLVPEKYSNVKTTPLKETVSAENNTFVFQLAD